MKKASFALAFSILIFAGCSKSSGGDSPGGGGNTPSCTGTPGTLFTQVRTIVQANCAISGCHTGPQAQNGINFSDNCTIVNNSARIKVRAVDEAGTPNQMPAPPNPTLSPSDRSAIVNWINAGAKITD